MINLAKIFSLCLIIFFIISCDENSNELGIDLLPPTDELALKADSSINFNFTTILNDSAVSYYTVYGYRNGGYQYYDPDTFKLLGDFSDYFHGKKKADLMLRFSPFFGYNVDSFPDNSHADSLILYLKIKRILLGDPNVKLKYSIYEVIKDINPIDTVFYTYSDLSTYKSTNPILEGEYNAASDYVRIKFPMDNELTNRLMNITYKQMDDSLFLKDILKGLYISVDKESNPEGSMILFNTQTIDYITDTRLTLYYNDSSYFNFYQFNSFNGAFSLKSDLTNTLSENNTNYSFVQGLIGPYTQLNIPSPFETWKDSGFVAINKVEFILYPATDLTELNNYSTGYPEALQMFYQKKGTDGKLNSYLIANAEFKNGVYNFNISNYYQYLVRNKLENSPILIKDANRYNSNKIMAVDKNGKSILKILYSKINN